MAENGAASHSRVDNFYFVAPGNRMVMFGPDRKDRLIYYRQTAPATLDFDREEMARIALPAFDPEGVTRCTGLRWLISDPKAATSIACGSSSMEASVFLRTISMARLRAIDAIHVIGEDSVGLN